jgi:multiple sugar transport system substrate-binding protein
MAQVTRRKLLKLSGAGVVAAKAGGIATILATGRAPAYAQATTVHWIRWNDFVPASDQLLRRELLPECEKATGIKVNLETVNGNDLQPRITSAIQSGAGPDLFMLFNNHPHLYAASAVDLSDIAEDIGKTQGGWYKVSSGNCNDGKKWLSMPFCIVGAMNAYRKSWYDEVGFSKYPETWDEYRDAGKKLKAKGHPLGQALGHSFGDPPTFAYPLMWSFGGNEVDESGKVTINSKETIESVKFMTAMWKEAFDEGGLAWDDSSNNRAFLSGTISSTLNGASIYIEATRKPDQYKTEKGAALQTDILHAPLPKGPAGQFGMHTFESHLMPSYSKNRRRRRTSCAGCTRRRTTRSGSTRRRASRPRRRPIGRRARCGRRTPSCCRSRSPASSASCRAARGCRTPRPPRCCRNTSSPTCTPRRSRAALPRRRSPGPRAS